MEEEEKKRENKVEENGKTVEEKNKCKTDKYVKQEKKEEEKEQMDSLNEEKDGGGNFKNEEEEEAIEAKEIKTKGMERRRKGKDDWKSEEDDKRMEGFLESEREEEEVMVVSRVKEMMGAIVWEYTERKYAEWEYTELEGQAFYAWDILDRGILWRSKDVFSKMRSIVRGEYCVTNREITRRRRRRDECLDVWWPVVGYHESSNEACYVFPDNTCVVCARVVFTGQCIFHK